MFISVNNPNYGFYRIFYEREEDSFRYIAIDLQITSSMSMHAMNNEHEVLVYSIKKIVIQFSTFYRIFVYNHILQRNVDIK